MIRPILAAFILVVGLGLQWPAAIAIEVGAPHEQPNPYQGYSCQRLEAAAQDLARRAGQPLGNPNGRGVDFVVIWPRIFSTAASGAKAAKLEHLKQEMISIEQASIDGECPIQFDGLRPPGA